MGRPLGESQHLRYIGQLQWRESEDSFESRVDIELNHRLEARNALRYSWMALGRSASRPYLEDSFVQVPHRRDLLGGYLFCDVSPEIHFPDESGHDGRWALGAGRWALGAGRWALGAGRWALALRLEMYFRSQCERAVP